MTKTKTTKPQGAKPATKKTAKPANPRHEVKCFFCGRTIPRPAWDKSNSPYYIGTNNPWPFAADDADARCCDECNTVAVIPARIRGLTETRARSIRELVSGVLKH